MTKVGGASGLEDINWHKFPLKDNGNFPGLGKRVNSPAPPRRGRHGVSHNRFLVTNINLKDVNLFPLPTTKIDT